VLYQAELLPEIYGAPERSRTPNLLIRSQTLYPIELRALNKFYNDSYLLSHVTEDYFAYAKIFGAEDRNRTGTVVTYRRILSPVRLPVPPPRQNFLERKTGFEPATPTLARWCSTTELLPRNIMVRVKGLEPPRLAAPDPKSGASANSATPA
jgi:hypothetical protein